MRLSTSAALFALSLAWPSLAIAQIYMLDYTEGGHVDSAALPFLNEWWYLNGSVQLLASDGEIRTIGFLVNLSHAEERNSSVSGFGRFHVVYDDSGPSFQGSNGLTVPKSTRGQYFAYPAPFVDYSFPEPGGDNHAHLNGKHQLGYTLDYKDGAFALDVHFVPNVAKTVDQASTPLNFATYEHAVGPIAGEVTLNNKVYTITGGEGYVDHMIPSGTVHFARQFHGWSWAEVTTPSYQVIVYGIRSLCDYYTNYHYKHMTVFNRATSQIIASYSGDQLAIDQYIWMNEANRQWPQVVIYSAGATMVGVWGTEERAFEYLGNNGFVDFMTFDRDAFVTIGQQSEQGTAFYEYMVTNRGAFPDYTCTL